MKNVEAQQKKFLDAHYKDSISELEKMDIIYFMSQLCVLPKKERYDALMNAMEEGRGVYLSKVAYDSLIMMSKASTDAAYTGPQHITIVIDDSVEKGLSASLPYHKECKML